MVQVFRFPGIWVGGPEFEHVLGTLADPLRDPDRDVRFTIPADTKLKVDAAVRLLSLANQLQTAGKLVMLDFSPEETAAFSYLNRMGYFELLHPDVQVLPMRPDGEFASRHHGRNTGLVEFARIRLGQPDRDLPSRLESALMRAIRDRERRQAMNRVAYTLFAELVDNVLEHSGTSIDGYAVLQVHRQGGSVLVAVSDSGVGLLESLKPTLPRHHPDLVGVSDTKLLTEMLRRGVSRRGQAGGGAGLTTCAARALKFKANLDVRLPMTYFRLTAKGGRYQPAAQVSERLPLLQGTHLAFDFKLD